MNRRRNLPSRRQWALRLGLLAALLMLLTGVISVVLPLHHLTPGQVREAAARRQGAVETQPIASRRFQGLSWQLSANDQLLLLSPYRFGFRDGWETDGGSAPAADRTQAEGPICCLGLSVTDSDGIYVQVAGLVSLEPAVAARITLPARQPGRPPVTADVNILPTATASGTSGSAARPAQRNLLISPALPSPCWTPGATPLPPRGFPRKTSLILVYPMMPQERPFQNKKVDDPNIASFKIPAFPFIKFELVFWCFVCVIVVLSGYFMVFSKRNIPSKYSLSSTSLASSLGSIWYL